MGHLSFRGSFANSTLRPDAVASQQGIVDLGFLFGQIDKQTLKSLCETFFSHFYSKVIHLVEWLPDAEQLFR